MDDGMTPTELETYVRQRYNALGDNFFPQLEIFNFFYEAQVQLATEAKCIRNIYTTTSVEDQRVYDFPTNAFAIARVEYDGERIKPNDFIDDDAETGNSPDDDITGRAEFYQQWGQEIYLRPIPNADGLTIKIYTYDLPNVPTAVGTLDVPVRYHMKLANYALHCMTLQDKNIAMADRFQALWDKDVKDAIKIELSSKTEDQLRTVKDYMEFVDTRYW
jgi:hypothetical protein